MEELCLCICYIYAGYKFEKCVAGCVLLTTILVNYNQNQILKKNVI